VREQFHGQLRHLGNQLAGMSEIAARQMRLATKSLLDSDLGVAEQVLAEDATLDADRDRCEQDAQKLLALQAPVAGDLRTVIAALHCAQRIERMGDLARHVAEASRRNHPEPVVPAPLVGSFAELGRLDVDMADALRPVILDADGTAFERMVAMDERVDTINHRLMTDVTDTRWRHGVAAAVNIALLARFYERFADQAVSVARQLDFALTGTLPR
jgi:phosphate transport system protein